MDPLDCDGEANARPIPASAAIELAAVAAYFNEERDCDDVEAARRARWASGAVGPTDRATKERIQGAARRRCGTARDQMPYMSPNYLAGWDEEDQRIRDGAYDVEGDCPGPRVARSGVVAIIVQANARAAWGDLGDCDGDEHLCTLCSVTIPPTADRVVWTWTPEGERHPITLHAHRGCDAIRREIDLGEWTQGDLLDRLVEWADDDPLNHDLRELDANLTPEQRADMGGEIIAAAIRALDGQTDACPGCPSCQPVPCEGESPVVQYLLREGACADCGGIVRTIEQARRHEDGHACAERNEAEQEPTITVVWHCDGSGRIPQDRR